MKVADVGGVGFVYDGVGRSGLLLGQGISALSAGEGSLSGARSAGGACDPIAAGACDDMISALVRRVQDLGESLESLLRGGRVHGEAFHAADGS